MIKHRCSCSKIPIKQTNRIRFFYVSAGLTSIKLGVYRMHNSSCKPFHCIVFQVFVPEASKDEKYWVKRTKNNIAAKRSRESRRIKENRILLRAAYLEKENCALKREIKKMKEEMNEILKQQMSV